MPGSPRTETYHGLAQSDYVNVMCMHVGGDLVMVRQYRPVLDRWTVEFPAACEMARKLLRSRRNARSRRRRALRSGSSSCFSIPMRMWEGSPTDCSAFSRWWMELLRRPRSVWKRCSFPAVAFGRWRPMERSPSPPISGFSTLQDTMPAFVRSAGSSALAIPRGWSLIERGAPAP